MSRSPISCLSAVWLLCAMAPACGASDPAPQQGAREPLVEEVRSQALAPAPVARLAMQQVPPGGLGLRDDVPTLGIDQDLYDLVVHRGDTLVALAQQAGISVEELAAWNDRSVHAPLRNSEVLRVPLAAGDAAGFEHRRAVAEDDRLQRYMEGRGSLLGVMTREVRSGETAWGIAMDEGAHPLWVVAMFNRTLDLDHLTIGVELVLPVLGDQLPIAHDDLSDPGERDDPTWLPLGR
jgi:LysM domain